MHFLMDTYFHFKTQELNRIRESSPGPFAYYWFRLLLKARSKRKNIKDVLEERGLKAETRAAKVDEENRRARMLLKQNQLLKEVSNRNRV